MEPIRIEVIEPSVSIDSWNAVLDEDGAEFVTKAYCFLDCFAADDLGIMRPVTSLLVGTVAAYQDAHSWKNPWEFDAGAIDFDDQEAIEVLISSGYLKEGAEEAGRMIVRSILWGEVARVAE